MSTVQTIYDGVEARLNGVTALSATTEPTSTDVLTWINETCQEIQALCAEERADIGRTTTTVTTVKAEITGVSQANPAVVTSPAHGIMSSGTAEVLIKEIVGMTELNDAYYTATYIDANSYSIGVDSSTYTAYSSGGTAYKTKYAITSLYAPAEMLNKGGVFYWGWIEQNNSRDELYLCSADEQVDYSPFDVSEPEKVFLDESGAYVRFLPNADGAYTIKLPVYSLPTALTGTSDTIPFNGLFDNLIIEMCVIRANNRDEYDLSFELKWMQYLREQARRVIHMRRGQNIRIGVRR